MSEFNVVVEVPLDTDSVPINQLVGSEILTIGFLTAAKVWSKTDEAIGVGTLYAVELLLGGNDVMGQEELVAACSSLIIGGFLGSNALGGQSVGNPGAIDDK